MELLKCGKPVKCIRSSAETGWDFPECRLHYRFNNIFNRLFETPKSILRDRSCLLSTMRTCFHSALLWYRSCILWCYSLINCGHRPATPQKVALESLTCPYYTQCSLQNTVTSEIWTATTALLTRIFWLYVRAEGIRNVTAFYVALIERNELDHYACIDYVVVDAFAPAAKLYMVINIMIARAD